ncbi:MAG: PINc/VapC family ATPase [Candidatus Hydrothermarchaeota archaeon]
MKVLVPDTSVIIDGRFNIFLKQIKDKCKIVIPEAVISELENQANKGREIGFKGLDEVIALKKLAEEMGLELVFHGARPTPEQIKYSRTGEIDEIIRYVALDVGGTLVTGDNVQAKVAQIKGIDVELLPPLEEKRENILERMFEENIMSIHLKENVIPVAKKGRPGNIRIIKLRETPCTLEQLEYLAKDILREAKARRDGFIEIERRGATVIQLGPYRISICRPPFSDGFEITAVRPIAKVSLEDYSLSDKLMNRLEKRAEGILIAGPPGAGKSTFAQALAEFYSKREKIVKTMESPRDLQVTEEITQYSPLEGSMEKTADILLLVRPDYTIYDELRKTSDFQVFADMRLAGVGMIGVVHSTEAIDAIQRLIGRVEMGMIPQVVDTIIFIKDGWIKKVYEINFTVRVPTGMVEADLARPLVEVRDFDSGKVEYEIYTYGEEVIVMPLTGEIDTESKRDRAIEKITRELERYVEDIRKIDMISDREAIVYIDKRSIPRLLGRKGKRILRIEKRLGIRIDIRPIEDY